MDLAGPLQQPQFKRVWSQSRKRNNPIDIITQYVFQNRWVLTALEDHVEADGCLTIGIIQRVKELTNTTTINMKLKTIDAGIKETK